MVGEKPHPPKKAYLPRQRDGVMVHPDGPEARIWVLKRV
jgi:hypothetical protein